LQQASPLQELTCHMGSHLPPGRGDIPAFAVASWNWYSITLEGCKAELS